MLHLRHVVYIKYVPLSGTHINCRNVLWSYVFVLHAKHCLYPRIHRYVISSEYKVNSQLNPTAQRVVVTAVAKTYSRKVPFVVRGRLIRIRSCNNNVYACMPLQIDEREIINLEHSKLLEGILIMLCCLDSRKKSNRTTRVFDANEK